MENDQSRITSKAKQLLNRWNKFSAQEPHRSGLIMSNLEGVFTTAYVILTTGAYLTGYAIYLGLNDFHLGLLAAIPSIAYIPSLLSAHLAQKIGARKPIVLFATIMGRVQWIPMLLLAYISVSKEFRVWGFIIITLICSLLAGMCISLWQDWMSALTHRQIRGRYYGRRNALLNVSSIFSMLFAGWILDYFKHNNYELGGYTAIIIIALALGSLSCIALKYQYEPKLHAIEEKAFVKNFLKPLKDVDYRNILYGFAVLYFSLGISGAFFTAHMLKYLKQSYTEISYFNIYSLVIGIFFNWQWGRIMDKSGLRSVLIVNVILLAFAPFVWMLTLNGIFFVWLVWALVGMGWSGFGIAAFNLPFALSPKEGRSYYLGIYNIVIGVFFFIGSVIGGIIAERLQKVNFNIWFVHITNYNILFFISGIGRFASIYYFLKIKEVKDKGVLYLITFTSSIVYSKIISATKMALFIKDE